jgi:hypothetical protein
VPLRFANQAVAILAQDYSDLLDEKFGKDEVACPKCGGVDVTTAPSAGVGLPKQPRRV